MKLIVKLCVIIGAILGIVACNDEVKEPSDVALIITPSNSDTVHIDANEKMQYKLEYYTSTGGYVNRLEVRSFDPIYGDKLLLDTIYGGKTPNDTYTFSAPIPTNEQMIVTLRFTVWDTTGKTTSQERKALIHNNVILLQEIGPIVLFTTDGMRDALIFESPTQIFDHILLKERKEADMYLDVDENGKLVLLSATQARFVRYNEFDYASTDAISLQTVYGSSRLDDQISGLNINDIILVGHGSQAEGAFFVANIVYSGTENERSVQLNFKGMQRTTIKQY